EIAAGSSYNDRLDVLIVCRRPEDADDLGVALKCQRIFLVRPVERQRCHFAIDLKAHMRRLIGRQRQGNRVGGDHGASLPATIRVVEALVLPRTPIISSMSPPLHPPPTSALPFS